VEPAALPTTCWREWCSWPGVPFDWAHYEQARELHGFRVAHRDVQAASIILTLADDLVGLAVTLQTGVAESVASGLFRGAFHFLDRTGDSVLIHGCCLSLPIAKTPDGRLA